MSGQVLKYREKLRHLTQQDQESVPVRLCRAFSKDYEQLKSVENKIRISTKIPLLHPVFHI